MARRLLVILILTGFSRTTLAGMFELGATASYRQTQINAQNYSNTESYTGSLAYYFTEATALEASYTQGQGKSVASESETRSYFYAYGMDLILTIGGKDAPIRPYIKGGGAYVYKEIRYKQAGMDPLRPIKSCGIVPSGGAGLRIALTQTFSIRAGIEGQTSPNPDECAEPGQKVETQTDYAGRAGVSWMF